VRALADGLGVVRLLAAACLPWAFGRGGVLPLALLTVAAVTDFFDGIVARRAGGPTAYGAVLDNVADIAVVLAATGSAAALGLVPVVAPVAIALAFGAYAVASVRRTGAGPARSRLGRAAGVANYGLALLAAGPLAIPAPVWSGPLHAAGLVVAGMNLAAVLDRIVPRRTVRSSGPARATPGGGTGARSARS
jgi:CDP-diacylglycerol--glycerol-3-phosphate 3-phosphatidyltransferase